jgi:hypothetical protein
MNKRSPFPKYRNQKVKLAGRSFDSKFETTIFGLLTLRQRAKEFKEIQQQDQIYLTEAQILYKPDFKCVGGPEGDFWVEAKGFETPEWRIKRRLWMVYGPGPLEVWMNDSRFKGPMMKERIIPKGSQILNPMENEE